MQWIANCHKIVAQQKLLMFPFRYANKKWQASPNKVDCCGLRCRDAAALSSHVNAVRNRGGGAFHQNCKQQQSLNNLRLVKEKT